MHRHMHSHHGDAENRKEIDIEGTDAEFTDFLLYIYIYISYFINSMKRCSTKEMF